MDFSSLNMASMSAPRVSASVCLFSCVTDPNNSAPGVFAEGGNNSWYSEMFSDVLSLSSSP